MNTGGRGTRDTAFPEAAPGLEPKSRRHPEHPCSRWVLWGRLPSPRCSLWATDCPLDGSLAVPLAIVDERLVHDPDWQ